MQEVKNALESGEAVYLRGFGSFIVKTRAEKKGRNISKNVTIDIPAHNIPAFKPAKVFVEGVKSKVDVK
jgi:DNA-binding protein HU-beta